MTPPELARYLIGCNVGRGRHIEVRQVDLVPLELRDLALIADGEFGPTHKDLVARVIVFDSEELEPTRRSA